MQFTLRRIELSGNTVIGSPALEALAAPYIGARVSSVELETIRTALTHHYVQSGYVNSGALLPDQRVTDGVVRFEIVEGVLGDIEIHGNRRLRDSYFLDRLTPAPDRPFNMQPLQARIARLLETSHIDQIQGSLGPGDRTGSARLVLDVKEASPVSLYAALANDNAPSVGATGVDIHAQLRDLLGIGDEFNAAFGHSHGLRDYEASARLPVTSDELVVSLSLEGSESKVIEQPFIKTDIRSVSKSVGLGVSYPVYHEPGHRVSLELEIERRETQTFLLGSPFAFSAGIKPDGTSVVAPLRFSQSWLLQRRDDAFAFRSTFSVGLDTLGATRNSGGIADARFQSWQGQFRYARRFRSSGVQLIARAQAQFTGDRLLPLEKFAVGGFETVRGYRENQVVRDNGFAVAVETRVPVFKLPLPPLSRNSSDGQVELAPFVDFGRSWNTDTPSPDPTSLVGIGLGLRWHISQSISAQLYYARALTNTPDATDRDLQDDGIHFRVDASVF